MSIDRNYIFKYTLPSFSIPASWFATMAPGNNYISNFTPNIGLGGPGALAPSARSPHIAGLIVNDWNEIFINIFKPKDVDIYDIEMIESDEFISFVYDKTKHIFDYINNLGIVKGEFSICGGSIYNLYLKFVNGETFWESPDFDIFFKEESDLKNALMKLYADNRIIRSTKNSVKFEVKDVAILDFVLRCSDIQEILSKFDIDLCSIGINNKKEIYAHTCYTEEEVLPLNARIQNFPSEPERVVSTFHRIKKYSERGMIFAPSDLVEMITRLFEAFPQMRSLVDSGSGIPKDTF